jgi:hypothetical protein
LRNRFSNLLLAGAQKCGTTALYAKLKNKLKTDVCTTKRHPDEPSFYRKEVSFFSIERRFAMGADFYAQRWAHCRPEQAWRLDATPSYFVHPERIVSFYREFGVLEDLRVIFLLREPVSREVSWYKHWKTKASNPLHENRNLTLSEYWTRVNLTGQIAHEKTNFGLYGPVLARWFQLLPRTQILVLAHDEMEGSPDQTLRRVHAFLGVPPPPQNATILRKNVHTAKDIPIEPSVCAAQDALDRLYEDSNQQLYQLMEDTVGPSMEERPFRRFHYQCAS